uniref:Uncharacterized protein n=1 Tax=Apteryx owenii TaxID=8824 RepID=A0A8B9Q687_APTOW
LSILGIYHQHPLDTLVPLPPDRITNALCLERAWRLHLLQKADTEVGRGKAACRGK